MPIWLLALTMTGAMAARPAATRPAASSSEIPALADLLNRARWEATPELSGTFLAGRIFEVAPDGSHRLVATDCVAANPISSTYTSTELIAQLQTGVRVDLKGLSLGGTTRMVKKVRFGTPTQASVPGLDLTLSPSCQERLLNLDAGRIGRCYVVQEALLATISEQTCGMVDARGRIIGIGEVGAEWSEACSQQSFEPVVVGYRTVPLRDIFAGPGLPAVTAGVEPAPAPVLMAPLASQPEAGAQSKVPREPQPSGAGLDFGFYAGLALGGRLT